MRLLIEYALRFIGPGDRRPVMAGAPSRPAASARLTLDAQWSRLRTLGERRSELARSVVSAQALAAEKLHAADYALDRLMDELATVMDLKPRARPTAVIVPVRPVDVRRRRLAA